MLVANPIVFDGRVLRHAQTLAEAGHRVAVLGVLGPADRVAPLPEDAAFSAAYVDRRRRGVLPRLRWVGSALRQRAATRLAERVSDALLARLPFVAELAVATSGPELCARALALHGDVFHGNDLNTLPAVAWAAALRRRPYLYDAHELYVDEQPAMSAVERRTRRAAEGRHIRGAAAVLTVNDLIADELVRLYRVPRPVVVRNLPPLHAGPGLDADAIPLGERGTLRLLYQGAHVGLSQQGTDDILRAMARLRDRVDVRLTVRGGLTAGEEARLRERIAGLGLCGRVRLCPPVPGAAALVEAAVRGGEELGLAVHPDLCGSYRYTTSSKVFEYQVAGLAVCATDLPGNRLSVDEEAGIFYPAGDDRRLAAILAGLAGDRERLRAMRRAARRRAETELCWDKERRRLLAVYEAL